MKISQLFVYPVKSCRGIPFSVVGVLPYGLAFDRQLMLIESVSGTFLSQRSHPKLALVGVDVNVISSALSIEAPRMPTFTHRMEFSPSSQRVVTVHTMPFIADDQGDEASVWFSEYLGVSCRLVAVHDSEMRRRALDNFDEPMIISCHDSASIHNIGQPSLDYINEERVRTGSPKVSYNCFRPNIVTSDHAPFEENRWKVLRIGDTLFERRKLTARCSIVDVDPDTGERGTGVLKTLANFRNSNGKIYFGTYFYPRLKSLHPVPIISVGQEIEVVELVRE